MSRGGWCCVCGAEWTAEPEHMRRIREQEERKETATAKEAMERNAKRLHREKWTHRAILVGLIIVALWFTLGHVWFQ